MKNKTVTKRILLANLCVAVCIAFIAPFFIDYPFIIKAIASGYFYSSLSVLISWHIRRRRNINKPDMSWYVLFFLCLAGVLSVVYVLMNLLETSYLAKVYVLCGITFVGGLYFIYKLLKKNK
ncbi:MAG: hypothetical protein LBC98_08265 [Prevotellaceae bacterium]|jgi:amino acid transporter|nr:hypothetical protein [Prevotellaceae bacterium]